MKLEKHLVLNKYFLNFFGFNDFNELREKLKDVEEGFDSTGRSYFIDVLIGLKPEYEDVLLKYDGEIREYVERLRKNRMHPNFNLKYFQFLAVLFTEIFLDRYYNDKQRFFNELNEFLEEFNNKNRNKNRIEITPFTEEDLKKLAYWMATGSGKTLIMHLNYWQILKYSKNQWDNIILITPNEGLSKQHYEELRLSGIPCKLYDGNIDNLKTKDDEVLIIDINKLTVEKQGEGVSVDISYFDGRNLVFIDEGHKGAGGKSENGWKSLREKIARKGFAFEYSATFGQIIEFTKSGNPKGGKSNQINIELYHEYTKAIIYNYSYKYFYADGYGKDFYVYNIKEDSYTEAQRDLLLTAGLLSFYEQLEIFEKHREELKNYNIEKPLWIFVGSKVTGKGINSDVMRVIQFLDKIIKNEGYLKENIKKIFEGNSDLIDNEGKDIFDGKFELIRNLNIDILVENIYLKMFGGRGILELHEIKTVNDEIGLKTSTSERYFGVINVEKISELKKIVSEAGIKVKEDHFSHSLFDRINQDDSSINLLIGSKKFIEGWNSWRVSNMGLINMGKGEGPQIIQLFGRGVRLKGKDYSLKREETPDYKLKVLQTLFIFGLNADYINTFLTTIEEEEVGYEEISIPIKFNKPEEWEGKIYTIKTKDDFDFLNYSVKLTIDENILRNIKIDLRPKITVAHGLRFGNVETIIDEPIKIPEEYFDIVDWSFIYSEVMNYKTTKAMYNLIIDINTIKQIVKTNIYKIFLSETEGINIVKTNGKFYLNIISFEGIRKIHEIILMVLKEYIKRFYRKAEKRKTMDYIEIESLTINDYPFMYPEDNKVVIKIPKSLTDEIKEVIKQLEEYDPGNDKLPAKWKDWDSFIIHLDNHLYTPLIIWKKNKEEINSVPVKLNKGETKFLEDFKSFLVNNNSLIEDYDIFLLRNLSKKGIGFFLRTGFYPDFVIWVRKKSEQRIIFVDPKGIRNLGNFNDDKIQFCVSELPEISKRLIEELNRKGEIINLQMSAFILSVSEYDKIRETWHDGKFRDIRFENAKKEFERYKILFVEDPEYMRKILGIKKIK
jgi:hypothetical protein